MKIRLSILILWIMICKVNGQLPFSDLHQPDTNNDSIKTKKIAVALSMGTSFISTSHAGNGTSSFIAPSVNYRFSPKLSLNTGLLVSHNNFSVPVEYFNPESRSVVIRATPVESQNIFYATGNYYVTPRLLITGSLMQTFSETSNIQSSRGLNNSFKIMSMGFEYKISENITIGARTHIVQSNGLNCYPQINNTFTNNALFPF